MLKRHALATQMCERMRFRATQAKFCVQDVVSSGLSFPDDNMCEMVRERDVGQHTAECTGCGRSHARCKERGSGAVC